MRPLTLGDRFQSWVNRLASLDRFELLANLTLLLFLFSPGPVWYVRVTSIALACTAIIYPPLKRSSIYWFIWFTFIFGVRCYIHWPSADNHTFLFSFWCLTLGCSLLARDQERVVKLNAQWYVGLVFGFATLWKVLSTEYLNGSVFQFFLTMDPRFFEIAHLLGDYSSQMAVHNREVIEQMWTAVGVVRLGGAPDFILAQCLTWWTLLIEATIAILFLVPNRYRLEIWRHVVLQLFIVVTYPPTHIVGFGWILIILGWAQCQEDFRKIQVGYFILFVLLSLFGGGDLIGFIFGTT